MTFIAKFTEHNESFHIVMNDSESFSTKFDSFLIVPKPVPSGDWPLYDGPIEVTPNFNEQILETAQTSVRDDITVLKIPYYEVTSVDGGTTVYIGMEAN